MQFSFAVQIRQMPYFFGGVEIPKRNAQMYGIFANERLFFKKNGAFWAELNSAQSTFCNGISINRFQNIAIY
jgi:hypothetical protein